MAAAERGPVQQIEAGVLDVGYLDVGPPDGQAVVFLHGWPYDIHSELLTVQLGVGFAASIKGQRRAGTGDETSDLPGCPCGV